MIAKSNLSISSMILIFALDIRRGLPVFIIALAAIGWTEIAQYIRSEFLVLRKMPFIEGARSAEGPWADSPPQPFTTRRCSGLISRVLSMPPVLMEMV